MALMRSLTMLGLAAVLLPATLLAADTLPRLDSDRVPQSVRELWKDYDPDREPLDLKVIREWQDEGITVRYITYTIGTFKRRKSTMAAFYAFPAGTARKLPALIQMHGGGQRASIESVKMPARNGYAALSINWGGRPMEGARRGEPTTDWGAVDATQTGHNSHYSRLTPDNKTIDAVESPRNNNWFLIVIGARRGVTLLQQQPEVDPDRIGAFGHSMGGKLTVMLAGAEGRIKAGAPSCGGCGAAPDIVRNRVGAGVRRRQSELYHKTIDDALYVREITAPMLYVGPQNDFNGILDNMYANWKHMPSDTIAFTVTPHMNHRAIPEHTYASILWFEDHLKGVFEFPRTPELTVNLDERDGIPSATLKPDTPGSVSKVDIYYSTDSHILTRFWHTAPSVKVGDRWITKLPVMNPDRHLFVMANVYYPLTHAVKGYRWDRKPETYGITSEMLTFTPQQLKTGGVKPRAERSRLIQAGLDDDRDFQDWYRLNWGNQCWWAASTRKIKDPKYAGPDGAGLLLDVKVDKEQTFFFQVSDNRWGAYPGQPNGDFYALVDVQGSPDWQTVSVAAADFKPVNARTRHRLNNWRHVTELGIHGRVKVEQGGKSTELPADPQKPNARRAPPRAMRNLRWEGGTYPRIVQTGKGTKVMSEEEYKRQFQKGIDDSIELEERDN